MKRRSFMMGVTGATLACAQRRTFAGEDLRGRAAAPAGHPTSDGYRLVKDWDFTKTITNSTELKAEFHTRYIYADQTLDHLNDEWSRYRDNNNHVFTADGLALTARLVGPLQPGGVESGMLRSRWVGQYGVYEICMKVPRAAGMWPGFWLNPEDKKWPPEIDVVEIVNHGTNGSKRSYHYLHGVGGKGAARHFSRLGSNEDYQPGFDYADDFHVFAVEWTPVGIKHYVDGTLVNDRAYRWIHNDGTDGGMAHVLVQLAVGGRWPGPPLLQSFPSSLVIRNMRVWQR